jgi:hypothetical protein
MLVRHAYALIFDPTTSIQDSEGISCFEAITIAPFVQAYDFTLSLHPRRRLAALQASYNSAHRLKKIPKKPLSFALQALPGSRMEQGIKLTAAGCPGCGIVLQPMEA